MLWFRHDSNANNDAKLKKVLMKYKAEGYALYWYCLELIASDVSGKKITFELEHDAEIIGYALGIDQIRAQEMMAYMVQLGLFEINQNNRITCLKMAYRLDESTSKNPHIRSYLKGLNSESSEDLPKVSESVRLDKNRLDKNRKEEIIIDKTKEVAKPKVEKLNWSIIGNISKDQIAEIKGLRFKAKCVVNQRFVNSLAKQFELTYITLGTTLDEILDVWTDKGWKTYKHEWFMNLQLKSTNQQSAHEIAATYGVIK